MFRTLTTIGLCAAFALAARGQDDLTAAQKAQLSQHFGFGPMQIYKLKPQIGLLELADLDADGRTDIALWNAYKSRIELFYQPEPDTPVTTEESTEPNEVPSRGNLRRENVPVAYRVATFKIAELTGDKRPDIVFFGEPRELVVLPGREDGGFGPPNAMRAPEGEPRNTFLDVGDFNHDGRTDVALLGNEILQIFHQKPNGGLAKPERLVHGIGDPGLMLAADLNGDQRDDLAIGAGDEQYGMYVYIQSPRHTLSAVRRIRIPRLRSMTFAPGPDGDLLFGVEQATGHLKLYRWQVRTDNVGLRDWPQRLYSYPFKLESRRLPFAVGDITGDGLADCVGAAPDAAQFILFAGTRDGLAAGKAFPGLLKTATLVPADLVPGGPLELISLSTEEKTVAISRFEDGRLTFPTPLDTDGEPLAVAAGPLRPEEPALIVCAVRLEGEDHEKPFRFRILDPRTGEEKQGWDWQELEDDPSGMELADVNQDGRADLLVFFRYADLLTFLQKPDGTFEHLTGRQTRASLVRDAQPTAFCQADVTNDGKPEMLLAQRGLARALVVRDGQWTVVDQYNPETAGAEITGLAALPGKPGSPTLVMYDRQARDLLVLQRRDDGTYAVTQTMPVGNYDLSVMRPLPIGEEAAAGLLMADNTRLALLTPDEVAPTLVEQQAYETDIKDAWLGDAVVGDLNDDSIRDVVAIDMRKANLEILTTAPDGDLVRALHFQVFQGKRFSGDPDSYGEPRAVLMGDVTGDETDDIVLIVHDRLIVYPAQ